jgi:hypothetical protein
MGLATRTSNHGSGGVVILRNRRVQQAWIAADNSALVQHGPIVDEHTRVFDLILLSFSILLGSFICIFVYCSFFLLL